MEGKITHFNPDIMFAGFNQMAILHSISHFDMAIKISTISPFPPRYLSSSTSLAKVQTANAVFNLFAGYGIVGNWKNHHGK